MIYHHMRALAEISSVRNVFLVGGYSPESFSTFIEKMYGEFTFASIDYISDDSPDNEAGILFKYKEKLMAGDPEYFFCLRYKLCSSFALHKMLKFHKGLEQTAK